MTKISFQSLITLFIHLFLLTYIIADCFFRDSAFASSNSFASSLQSSLSSPFFQYFFITFCNILCQSVTGVLFLAFYSISLEKTKILAFYLYFFLISYVCSMLKLIYHDPRPYWASNVKAFECYSEYGNPSGHSMMSIVLFGIIWQKYVWIWVQKGEVSFLRKFQKEINENLIKENDFSKPKTNKNSQFLIYSLFIAFVVFMILFGRIYLGMHSYNEVFLGFFYGFYFLYVYLLYIEDIFIAFLHSIIIKNAHDININQHRVSWLFLVIFTGFYLLFLLIPIITFETLKDNIMIPMLWLVNIMAFCPNNGLFKMFYYKCFLDCGVISILFGILFGIIFTKGRHSLINGSFINLKRSFSKELARILIVIGICGGISEIFNLLPNNNDIYQDYFINMNLGTFLGGFGLIKLVPFVYNKMGIDYEGDFLRYQEGEMVVAEESEGEKEMQTIENGQITSV